MLSNKVDSENNVRVNDIDVNNCHIFQGGYIP